MAIGLEIYQNNRKGGNRMFYYRPVYDGTVGEKEIAQKVQDNCTAKLSDCRAIIAEFHSVLKDYLCDSFAVQIDGLGMFKINMKSAGAIAEERWNPAEYVRGTRLVFLPELHKMHGNPQRYDKDAYSHYVMRSEICHDAKFELTAYEKKNVATYSKNGFSFPEGVSNWNQWLGRTEKKN